MESLDHLEASGSSNFQVSQVDLNYLVEKLLKKLKTTEPENTLRTSSRKDRVSNDCYKRSQATETIC